MHRRGMISIWFFIGVLLLALRRSHSGAGIYELRHPPANRVVLATCMSASGGGPAARAGRVLHPCNFRPGRT